VFYWHSRTNEDSPLQRLLGRVPEGTTSKPSERKGILPGKIAKKRKTVFIKQEADIGIRKDLSSCSRMGFVAGLLGGGGGWSPGRRSPKLLTKTRKKKKEVSLGEEEGEDGLDPKEVS